MIILTLGYLLINSWTDWRSRMIDIRYTIAYFILAGLVFVCQGQCFLWFGSIPGIFLLFMSFITKRQIGIGDGIMIMMIGCVIGLKEILYVLQISFMIAAIWGIVLFVKKKRKTYTIPFAPCLLFGYLLQLLK